MPRSFSDAALAAMARTPREQLAAALDELAARAGDGATAPPAGTGPSAGGAPADLAGPEAVAVFRRLARSFTNFVDGFSTFIAGVQEYVHSTHGFAAAGALDAAIFRAGLREIAARGVTGVALDDADTETAATEITAALERGDRAGALDAYDRYEATVRVVHDLGVGRAAAALTHVYRTFGVDALEACIRLCGERSLLQWMPHDVARPAHQRIGQWARMMSGNFASITVTETDDAFVITQDPCGTCARQVLDGCYEPPIDYAVVTEAHPITWNRGQVPVYRTHVAVMHDLMPLERIGVRWPEITCPEGVSGGPCTVLFRKSPATG